MLLAAAAPARGQPNVPAPENTFTYEQRLGAEVPRDAVFADEEGRAVALADYLDWRPVILVLAQYRCPMLCNQVLNGVLDCVRGLPGDAGEAFDVVVVSFDPREQPELAAAKKRNYVEEYGRPGGARGWHFLTGKQEAIGPLAEAVGFRYAYSALNDRYAHGSGVVVLTPKGVVSRYFFGVFYDTAEMKQALETAARGETGKTVPQFMRVLMLCYESASGNVMNLMRAAAALTVLLLGSFLALSWLRGRRAPKPAAAAPAGPDGPAATKGGGDA